MPLSRYNLTRVDGALLNFGNHILSGVTSSNMAFIKAILFALVAINLQSAHSKPAVVVEIAAPAPLPAPFPYPYVAPVVVDFLDVWYPPLYYPLTIIAPPIDAEVIEIVAKARDAVAELLDQEQITEDQAHELMVAVLDAAAENDISAFTAVDIALEEAVGEEIIDTDTKVLILLAGIREGLHDDPPETLEEQIEAWVDAAVGASVIDDDEADDILDVVPDEVDPDPDATISADDVADAVGDEDDPVAVADDVEEVAEKAVDAYTEAADQGLISEDDADDVIDLVWEAAKSNDLTELSQVDIALAAAVDEEVIDDEEKVLILMNAINEGLHDDLPEDLEEAVEAVLDAAVDAEIIDEDTEAAIMDEIPDEVDPDADATISDEDVADAA